MGQSELKHDGKRVRSEAATTGAHVMDRAIRNRLLVNSLGDEALKGQLDFLRETLLAALDVVEAIRATYVPAGHELQLGEAMKQFEVSLLRAAMFRSQGNQTRAAKLLGVKLTTLNAKLKRHNIIATSDRNSENK
jgi:DNA-binding NtrC family response regulator